MYSLAIHPTARPTIRNKMVKNEPNTRLTANIFLTSGNYFFLPRYKGKFKIDGCFPIEKANHLFKDDVKRFNLLPLSSIKNKINTTISVVSIIYVCHLTICFSLRKLIVSTHPPIFLSLHITCGNVDPSPNSE